MTAVESSGELNVKYSAISFLKTMKGINIPHITTGTVLFLYDMIIRSLAVYMAIKK